MPYNTRTMREWNLKPGDPLTLSLAADARLGPTDYRDDQIWELSFGDGVPPALSITTTYGLRARSFRMFPRFSEGEQTVSDPAAFHRFPTIRQIYPNYLHLDFAPFPGIEVEAEYWVPQSQAIAGRLRLANTGEEVRLARLEWVAQLTPTEGQRMAPMEQVIALAGRTAGLAPVVFLTGGPVADSAPFPALSLNLEIAPNTSRPFTWSHAALEDPETSLNLARQIATRPWEAEIARLSLTNQGIIEIHTGDRDWDVAFALAQKTAFGLFSGPTTHLPCASFVFTRQPDQGFSLRGDGSDYNHLWSGQTPLDTVYLAGLVLPSAPQLVQGLVRNFIATQTEDGQLDCKPGLGGQRSRLLATPLLASLAWRIFEITADEKFLQEVFPPLLNFVQAWFSASHDRDGDGIPEWDSLIQSGWEDHPLFSRWHPWSQSVEIWSAETPGLCALLYHECQSLIQMAGVLMRREPVTALASLADHLRTVVEASWDEENSTYRYWDRDTHRTSPGELLAQAAGPGEIPIGRSFEEPIRLLVRIHSDGESTRHPQVIVRGASSTGQHRVERLSDERFKWYLGQGTLTGDRVYSELEEIEVEGVDPGDQISIYTVGFSCQDQSLLLPLWAGIPSPERGEALVQHTLMNPELYWRPYGIPICPAPEDAPEAEVCGDVNLPWTSLIAEGLLRYGYRDEAAELVKRQMSAVIRSLKTEHAHRRTYNANTGEPKGERDALTGLAPLGLFLETLGIRLLSPRSVAVQGYNPFPWPVTVKYRGLTILRQREKTIVIFPDGQTVSVEDPAPQVITLQ
jgi:hypothetical protein